jgi:hypothetical protein
LAAACALVAPDGRGVSIHGARTSVAHRIVMSASRHFQSLDEEAAPAEDAPAAEESEEAPAEDAPADDASDAADAAAAGDEEEKKDKKKDEDKEEASSSGSKDKIVLMGDEELNVAMQRYYEAHPSAFQWSLWQQVIGGVIGLICCCVLVYSEVNAMLLTRDLDALKAAELISAPKSVELIQRELFWGNGFKAQWRTILTGGALAMCSIAVFVSFSSECPMLEKLAEKYDLSNTQSHGNCLVLAILLAILNATGLSALLAGVVWMCTRPLPGILLIVVSITADMFNTSDDYTPVITWIVCTALAAAAYCYFTMGGEEEEEEKTSKAREFA